MGAKWVFQWTASSADIPPADSASHLEAAILSMHGEKDPRAWENTCTLYNPLVAASKDRQQTGGRAQVGRGGNKDLYVVSSSDAPGRRCLILRHERQVIDAESKVMQVLDKMGMYKQKLVVEFHGAQYSVGDFGIRVGKMVLKHTGETHGVMVEMEYLPVCCGDTVAKESNKIIMELSDHLSRAASQGGASGKLQEVVAPLQEYPLPPKFSNMHSAVQYVALATSISRTRSTSAVHTQAAPPAWRL